MIATPLVLTLLALGSSTPAQPRCADGGATGGVLRFENGRWFDGEGFRARTVDVVDGRLVFERGGAADEVLDLDGGYVIPPLADAHTHGLATGEEPQHQVAGFLSRGIFYVKVPNNLRRLVPPLRPLLGGPGRLDARFSHGGLTCSGGHPVPLYEAIVGAQTSDPEEFLEGEAFFVVDSLRELDASWPHVLDGEPDFVKVYLERSELHAERRDDPRFRGQRGLDPALVPAVVERARAEGLTVAAHVTSAADFRTALSAGVDEITHVPLERLEPRDARRAAELGTWVVTTATSHRNPHVVGEPDALDAILRHNLRLLHEAGARLAVGTDAGHHGTVLDELEMLQRLDVFDPVALLRIATESTTRAIWPDRAVGRLAAGHEASFLVLQDDPLGDLAALRSIALAYKEGRRVLPADTAVAPAHAHAPLPNGGGDTLSREEKEADLDFLLETVREHHPDPYAVHGPSEWAQRERELRARLDELSDAEVFLALSHLLALLEDGHSGLYPLELGGEPWRRHRIELRIFADGVYVVAAHPDHRALLGQRVVAAGGVPVDEVLERLGAHVSGDNAQTRRPLQQLYLVLPEVHRALGLAEDPYGAWLDIRDAAGRETRVALDDLEPVNLHALWTPNPGWPRVEPASPPLWTQQPERPFFFELLDSSTAYLRCRAIEDAPDESLRDFSGRVFATLEREGVDRLIVDLRQNSGGNNYLNQPLLHGVLGSSANELGRLFVIVDGGTFSAAQNAATWLERETWALFAGEPTGGRPNHFGDAEMNMLPHSRSLLRCSTVRWQDSDPRDDRPWIYPDLPAPMTFADFRAGRDAALDAARAFVLREVPGVTGIAPNSHWMRAGQQRSW